MTLRTCAVVGFAIVALLGFSQSLQAQNDAVLLRLLQILRDRGSITAQEYEELRKASGAAAASDQTPRIAAIETQIKQLETETQAQQKSILDVKQITDGTASAAVAKALSGKWYERISLRGYTQFRFSEVFSQTGPTLEVPADRSVNPNESLVIRRGRFVFSGDLSDHLYLYAQSDFNGSTGAADFSVQMRDLYADIAFDKQKEFRLRLGQSKVPFGWSNLQSSQNRAPLERPDGINSAADGERDYGAYLMWASASARQRFRDIVSQGLKGSGDYGVIATGIYAAQGPNRSDQNGEPHVVTRVSYPFKTAGGKFFELGLQGYHGRFVSPTQNITVGGTAFAPIQAAKGATDQRLGFTAVWYPQPVGIEAEWNIGRGPQLSSDFRRITSEFLHGGYAQVNFRRRIDNSQAVVFPFARWNYLDGARKFARNAPRSKVNEMDIGLEFAPWLEVEFTAVYTRTFRRTNIGTFPYDVTKNANRLGLQVQWNY